MRLIDANVLKALLLKERDAIPLTVVERYGFGVEKPSPFGQAMCAGIRKALRCMEQCPTIEAVPVVRGRWIRMAAYKGMEDFKCSVCKSACHVPTCMGEPMYEYCPNCGAKMED